VGRVSAMNFLSLRYAPTIIKFGYRIEDDDDVSGSYPVSVSPLATSEWRPTVFVKSWHPSSHCLALGRSHGQNVTVIDDATSYEERYRVGKLLRGANRSDAPSLWL
jgi:hypothetical protein